MRLAFPADAAGRFVAQGNGFFHDALTQQRFAAVVLNDSAENRELAWRLAYLRHPMLVPVVRIFLDDGKITLLSTIEASDEPVAAHWSNAPVNDVAAGLLHLTMLLRQLGMEPGWRRRHLIWRDGQVRCLLPDMGIDPAYQLPQESCHAFLESTSIYALGAFLLHLCHGSYHRPGEFRDPCLLVRRLRPGWSELLKRMVDLDLNVRPTYDEVLGLAAGWCKDDFRKQVKQRVFLGFQSEWVKAGYDLVPAKQRFAFVEKLPGRERISRLLPWVAEREADGDWVLQLWFPAQVSRRYGVLNQLIDWLQQLLVRHGYDSVAATCEPLLEWREPQEVMSQFESLLRRVAETLVGQHCRRMWWLVEDSEQVDAGSRQVLIELVQQADHDWLGIVVTGLFGIQLKWQGFLDHAVVVPLPRLGPDQIADVMPGLRDGPKRQMDLRLATSVLCAAEVGLLDGFERLWQALSPQQQLLVKLTAILPEKIDVALVEHAFELRDLTPVFEKLLRLNWFHGSAKAFGIVDVGCREWVVANIDVAERLALIRTIFAVFPEEDTHILLRAFLIAELEQQDALEQVLAHLHSLVETQGNFDILWQLLAWPEAMQRAPFHGLIEAAKVLTGDVSKLTSAPFGNVIEKLRKGNVLRNRGDYRKAYDVYRALAATRRLAPVWKAEALVQMAFCAYVGDIKLGVPEVIRRFGRMTSFAEGFSQQRYDEWVAMLLGFLPQQQARGDMAKAEAQLASPLRAWVEAQRCLHSGDFFDAGHKLRLAASWLQTHPNKRLRALYFKARGIAVYRQNRAGEARAFFLASKRLFWQVGDKVGVANTRFNLASAEFLAGSLAQAQTRFQQMLDEATEPLLQCQLHYYLAACTQLRGQQSGFEMHLAQHMKLAKRLNQVEEQCKSLILRLWQPSLLQVDVLNQVLEKLDRMLSKHQFSNLLLNEAAVARSFACFGSGLPVADKPEIEANALTRWRLDLLAVLRGSEDRTIDELAMGLGEGYFAALHALILSEMVVLQRLSTSMLMALPKDFFKLLGQRFGAHYPQQVYRSLGSASPVAGADEWQQCLAAWDLLPDSGSFSERQRMRLFSSFAQIWPFQCYGLAEFQKGAWVLDGDVSWQSCVRSSLAYLPEQLDQVSLLLCVPNYEETSRSLLCFSLREQPRTLLWFVAEKCGQVRPAETLIRVYRKLFRVALGDFTLRFKKPRQEVIKKKLPQFGMIGSGSGMQAVREKIAAFAPSDLNIYIWGESGTGKELTARAFHDASQRAQGAFRAINCSHYTENLVASELFGHVRGAFTGAQSNKTGLLELVNGGTLFLDEIGDLSPKMQSLLLRVVQEGEFTRVGDHQIRHVDIRFICATNKSLHRLIDEGSFREDLFFRLVGEEVRLPALSARLEDLPELVRHFVQKYGIRGHQYSFSKSFFARLRDYHWPGNIRELESYVRKVLVGNDGVETFADKHCPGFLRPVRDKEAKEQVTLIDDYIEKQALEFATARLVALGGNRTRTAESLGISRQRLSRILQRNIGSD